MDSYTFYICGKDFNNIGYVSNTIKMMLLGKKIFKNKDIRRISVALFETETNIILYAENGKITVDIEPKQITIIARDNGKGIEDVVLALKDGYTTADENIRKLGFGAGLGLSNIKKNTDIFYINSKIGVGTEIILNFNFYHSVL